MDMRRISLTIALCLILALLCGCSSLPKQSSSPVPDIEPAPPEPIDRQANPGSLYQPSRADYLFEDNRATRVGDIVQVHIVETSSASSEANTEADKESGISVGVEQFLGKSDFLGLSEIPVGQTPNVKGSLENEFEGEGTTERETEVTGTIAVRVVRVLPNGLMQVQGSREIRVNDENQIITVSGLLRSRDIGPNNSVTSNQLADARIEYFGEGVLADQQKPGWMSRLLTNVWPF
jgi:flagellar L-ring protein precursor FlgH